MEVLFFNFFYSEISGQNQDKFSGYISSTGCWIHKDAIELQGLKKGPFIHLADSSILAVENFSRCCISKDQGGTWIEYPIVANENEFDTSKFEITTGALLRTQSGVIILPFMNHKERSEFIWDKNTHDTSNDPSYPTYAVRSLDGGKTWTDLKKLHNDWTGAIRDIIETQDGNIVFTSMMFLHNPGRNAVVTYTSKDEGKSWIRSNIIDLGGIGHHSGVMESTLEQLSDGRLWMLLRTNWGKFWEIYSEDEGLTWNHYNPTEIDASTAPGILSRMLSGRLVLVWNRYYPEGVTECRLIGGDANFSEVPVSFHRQELSIMFSDDNGKSWSKPVVIARTMDKKSQLAYPYIIEAKPGELWIKTSFQGNLGLKLFEKDFM